MEKLEPRTVTIYVSKITPGALKQFYVLPKDEKRRFHNKEFIVSRGLLREFLASYIGTESKKLRFKYNRQGKPIPILRDLITRSQRKAIRIRYSLSHSHGLVILGFTMDSEMGLDVERVRDIPISKIHPKSETSRLLASIYGQSDRLHFFRSWTILEAYFKALGDLRSRNLFSISRDIIFPNGPIQRDLEFRKLSLQTKGKVERDCYYCTFRPKRGFVASIVIRGPKPQRVVVFERLMRR